MPSTPGLPALEERLLRENKDFRPELDLLRAVAVILVVIDHTGLALHRKSILGLSVGWLGIVGVWMFFVHTALVLMWSLERKPYTLDFYIRRIFRVYPLALVAITVAALTRAPLTGTVDDFFQYHRISRLNFVTTAMLLHNLAPPHFHMNTIENVVWTLPLEVQMYVLLPVLFAFIYRSRAQWPLFVVWTLACGVAYNSAASFGFVESVPNFLPGVIAYAGYRKLRPRLSPWLLPPALAVAILAVLHHPTAPKGWVFSLALGVALPHFRSFPRSLFTHACHLVARYSFGIYLAHPFALVLGIYLLPGRPLLLQLGVVVTAIVVLSVAAYHLIEAPMIRLGARLAAHLETHPIFGERERSLT